jgi:DNA modification methylase
MRNDDPSLETVSFHCRSPIYMCATCTHAEKCADLLNILRMFKLDEKPPDFDLLTNFPFLKERSFEVDPRNKLNEVSSGEWLQFTRTVFSQKFPKFLGHELRRKHPEHKSPHLLGQLIAFFTKRQDLVLDPFAGTGTSLIAASLLGREAVGFEIERSWVDIYYHICRKHRIPRQKLVAGDCSELLHSVPPDSVDFVLIDPPNPMNAEEWAPNAPPPSKPVDAFFDFMLGALNRCHIALKEHKHMAVFTRNLYQNSQYIFLTPYFASIAAEAGFLLKGEKIWENAAEKLRPYGYPHSYVPNISHYSILIFQKQTPGEKDGEDDTFKQ